MQKLTYEIDENELKSLIFNHLQQLFNGYVNLEVNDIIIEVKSKQNYKSEWEVANFRARINKTIG